jgi:hypothetical protein
MGKKKKRVDTTGKCKGKRKSTGKNGKMLSKKPCRK